jgi:hypothetical protein
MAGPQSKSVSMTSGAGYDRYPVKDKNRPTSTVYFNSVKNHMKEHYAKELQLWINFFGEARWWAIVRAEMDIYTFNFEDNQCWWLYAKYKGVLNETKKPSSKACEQVQSLQENSESSAENAKATPEA